MRQRVAELIEAVRRAGVTVSLAEALDAYAAVAAIGIDRTPLREGLAAALVKHEEDRPVFDALFDALFAPRVSGHPAPRRRRPSASGEAPFARGAGGTGGAGTTGRPDESREPDHRRAGEPRLPAPARATAGERRPRKCGAEAERERRGRFHRGAPERAEILERPFPAMDPSELDGAREFARELGRRLAAGRARRLRRRKRGRVDIRRTIRASLSRGGVPFALERRGQRPGKPNLIALCDLSGSVAEASELLLSLLAGAEEAFRSIHRFAFVDRLVPIDFEGGRVRPEGGIDLWARSDAGRVLCELEREHGALLTPRTVLLVLGDARNNRRPARADALARIAARCRAVVWAVPEPRARWRTGDSALASYERHCRAVVEAVCLAGMREALRRALGISAMATQLAPG